MNDMSTGPIERTTLRGVDDGDADRVETTLGRINGVRNVQVNDGTADVEYDPTEVSETKLREALLSEGISVDGQDDAGAGLPEGSGSSGTGAQPGTGLRAGAVDVSDTEAGVPEGRPASEADWTAEQGAP